MVTDEVAVDERRAINDAVRRLVPEFRARALESERLRTMPTDLVDQAKAAGLFRLNLPRALGGFELDPATTVEIFEEISRADGSAGWTVAIGNSTASFAWLDPVSAKDMIGGNPDFVSTSMWAPAGQAVSDGAGGLPVSGRWPFNSGSPHADWLQVGVFVTDGGAPTTLSDGRPDWRFAFVPRHAATIEDTWDALGLRGTGSHHVSISGALVPADHLAAPLFEPARHDGPLWHIPLITLAAMFLAAVPLGIARRALDEFADIATHKVRGPASTTVAQDGDAQRRFAQADAGLRSARAFFFEVIGDVWGRATSRHPPSLEQRAQVLAAANHTVRAGVEAVDTVFQLAGAEAVLADQPLQRCFRDIHTVSQHVLFSAARDQSYARLRFGIDQSTVFI